MAGRENPALPGSLRLFSVFVILVLLVGVGLFLVPDLVRPRWPWKLAPFNARFLGAIYLTEMVAMAALLVWNRWSPARLILTVAFTFTLVVFVASALHLDRFSFQRTNGWFWFIVYGASAVISGAVLWWARDIPPVAAAPNAWRWRGYFRGEAAVLGLYGLALLIAPVAVTAFWPWPIDAFHGQVYSSIFITAAAGLWLLSRHAAREELIVLGLAQLALGALALIGLVVADSAVKRVDWAAAGTWVWVALAALIGVSGLAKLRAAAS